MDFVVCFFFCFHQLLNRDACYTLPLGNDEVFQPYRTLHALLIPEATNREPTCLKVAAPEALAVVAVQVAEPGGSRIELRRTPPKPTVANANAGE